MALPYANHMAANNLHGRVIVVHAAKPQQSMEKSSPPVATPPTRFVPTPAGPWNKVIPTQVMAEPLPYTPPPAFSGAYGNQSTHSLSPGVAWNLPARYDLQRQLGLGAFGTVREAFDTITRTQLAIKRVHGIFAEPTRCKNILREATLMSRFQHPNIVRLVGVYLPPSAVTPETEFYILMAMCQSDMQKMLRIPGLKLSNLQRANMYYGVLLALTYLHSGGICHRDIKPANCLVNEDCSVQVCDFGMACTVAELADRLASDDAAGTETTPWYSAPELILCLRQHDEAVDVWSAGCIFAELTALSDVSPARYEDRAPLFPGTLVSLWHAPPGVYNAGKHDQLDAIFNVIGTPSSRDLELLESSAEECVRQFPQRPGRGLTSSVPGASAHEAELLEKMIVFSPRLRQSAKELLAAAFLREVRDPPKELVALERLDCLITEVNTPMNLDEPPFLEEFRQLALSVNEGLPVNA